MGLPDIDPTPTVLEAILSETTALGFTMASEPKTGALLAALAAGKPAGRLLELGTGTGIGSAWLLSAWTPTRISTRSIRIPPSWPLLDGTLEPIRA